MTLFHVSNLKSLPPDLAPPSLSPPAANSLQVLRNVPNFATPPRGKIGGDVLRNSLLFATPRTRVAISWFNSSSQPGCQRSPSPLPVREPRRWMNHLYTFRLGSWAIMWTHIIAHDPGWHRQEVVTIFFKLFSRSRREKRRKSKSPLFPPARERSAGGSSRRATTRITSTRAITATRPRASRASKF